MEATEKDLRSEFSIVVNGALKTIVQVVEQDKDNRALMLLAVDKSNEKSVEVVGSIGGYPDLLIDALARVISKEKKFRTIIGRAQIKAKFESLFGEFLEGLSQCAESECENCEKKAECDLVNKENEN